VDDWNGGFDEVEEMDIDFCFFIALFSMVLVGSMIWG
jgi:hypothetical protein